MITRAGRGPLTAMVGAVVAIGLAVAGFGVATADPGGADDGRDAAVVWTDSGPVRGTVADDHRSFQGIPYASPPKGELRWRSPRPPTAWTEPRDATRPGNSCPQNPGLIGDGGSVEEDCLFVNVTTPRHTSGRKLPVMVWVHGNGFINGAGALYGGRPIATLGEVVVVTVNYRMNIFGFLAHPALGQSGNFGLEDQQAALRWVQRNAAAFGGDPRNVTLFGESAGGISTCSHLVSPTSAGLFHRAIVQSGACTMKRTYVNDWGYHTRQSAEEHGLYEAARVGCDDPATAASCLREADVSTLLEMPDLGYGFGPVYGDNPVLPLDPARALENGAFNKVPVMQGTTRDEHRTFTAGIELFTKHVLQPHEYEPEIRTNFGDRADRVLASYPLGTDNPSVALSTVVTDSSWGCQALFTDRMLARHVPTYAYEFADEHAPWFKDTPLPSFPTGAFHAGELQYLFDGAYGSGSLSPEQRRLSEQMIRYWTRFAHNGNPNGHGLPSWPRLRPHNEHVQSLAPGHGGIRPVDFNAEHRCDFWRSVGQ